MRYQICEVEVTAALPRVQLDKDEDGLAVVIRRHDRPVWFWMEKLAPKSVIEPRELATRLSTHAAAKLVNESIREELLKSGSLLPCHSERSEGSHEPSATKVSQSIARSFAGAQDDRGEKFPSLTIAICTHD